MILSFFLFCDIRSKGLFFSFYNNRDKLTLLQHHLCQQCFGQIVVFYKSVKDNFGEDSNQVVVVVVAVLSGLNTSTKAYIEGSTRCSI